MDKIEGFFPDINSPREVAEVFRDLANMLESGELVVARGGMFLNGRVRETTGEQSISLGAQLHFVHRKI